MHMHVSLLDTLVSPLLYPVKTYRTWLCRSAALVVVFSFFSFDLMRVESVEIASLSIVKSINDSGGGDDDTHLSHNEIDFHSVCSTLALQGLAAVSCWMMMLLAHTITHKRLNLTFDEQQLQYIILLRK